MQDIGFLVTFLSVFVFLFIWTVGVYYWSFKKGFDEGSKLTDDILKKEFEKYVRSKTND